MVINPTFVNMLLKTKNFNVMVVMLHAVGGYVCWIVGFDTAQCWKGFGGECSTVWLYLKYTDFVMTLLWEYTVPRLLPQAIIVRCITRVTAVGVFSAGTQACSQGKLGSARFASWGDYYEIKHLQIWGHGTLLGNGSLLPSGWDWVSILTFYLWVMFTSDSGIKCDRWIGVVLTDAALDRCGKEGAMLTIYQSIYI